MENNLVNYGSSFQIPLKLWFIGGPKVGKSSLIYKFLLDSLPSINLVPTQGKL